MLSPSYTASYMALKCFYFVILISILLRQQYQFVDGTSLNSILLGSPISKCVCPGDHLTFECSVQGGVATVWEGSAFADCGVDASSSFIRLRHSGFSMLEPARGECNNGLIVARSVGVLNDTFSSQLDVNVTADMNNKTIECALDATGSGDYDTLNITTLIIIQGIIYALL